MSITRIRTLACALATLAIFATAIALPRPSSAVAAGDCTTDPSLDAEEQAFLQLINNHRAQNGRAPLAISYKLSRSAQWKSDDLARNHYFAHDDLDRTWVQRIRDCDYPFSTYLGENIAAGNSTAQATFNQWVNSSGHNANMLSSSFTAIGIGRAYGAGSPYGWYWTTNFGGYSDGWVEATSPVSVVDQPAPPAPPADAPPSVSILTPRDGQPLPRGGYIIANATDDRHVVAVEFYVDGRLIKRDTRPLYIARVSRRSYLQPLTITVRAVDSAGQSSEQTLRIPAASPFRFGR